MLKVLSVFGTRPEAIKMAPVIKELERHPDVFQSLVCVTGQHRQMLEQALHLFAIRPDFDLDVMCPGQDLFDVGCGQRGRQRGQPLTKDNMSRVQG